MKKTLITKPISSLVIFCSAALSNSCSSQNLQKETAKKPNVVLIVVDDLGWTDLGVYGSDFYQTPNIDKLAKEGMRFTDSYATCTVCSPTRASILTGKYPARLHLTDWITGHERHYAQLKIPNWTQYLVPDEYTLAENFRDNGYKTYHIGKWHLGDEEKDWPEHHGFDKNVAGHKAGSPKAHNGGGYFSPYNNPRLSDGPENEYLTERLTSEVEGIIKETKSNPFFINFWFYNVHTPLQAVKEKVKKYEKQIDKNKHHQNPTYAAMVEHVDEAVGKVMKVLEENGVAENTIILLTSDNGGLVNTKKMVTSNYPLRSGKGDMYEGGVRIPLIVKWANKIGEDKVSHLPTTSVDLYPTIMELAGLTFQGETQDFDGISLAQHVLANAKPKARNIYWHYPHYHRGGAVPYSAVRSGDWKYIVNYETNSTELYNLKNDIGEKENLIDTQKEKAKELNTLLDNWLLEVDGQLPTKNDLFDKAKEFKWSISKSATYR